MGSVDVSGGCRMREGRRMGCTRKTVCAGGFGGQGGGVYVVVGMVMAMDVQTGRQAAAVAVNGARE